MEPVPTVSDDEREDGEIVDDSYEDISDFSIPSCGKSDYSQDLLSAISLSSISDSEGGHGFGPKHYIPARKRQRKKHEHNGSSKRRRKRKEVYERRSSNALSLSSSSDSDGQKVDKRMLRQLKEAVRINTTGEMHHNSLRTRLRGMIDPDTPESEEDEDLEALRTLALLSSNNDKPSDEAFKTIDDTKCDDLDNLNNADNLNDKELAELRSEALKSAVIKKHMERKKRKELLITERNEINNKENADDNIINTSVDEIKTNGDSVSIEDDVDVMRAMLLASMSTKITSVKTKINLATSTPFKPNSLQKHKPPPKTKLKIPSVKPLIINLRSDSDDSDFEINTTVEPPPRNNPIDHSVTEFLRKQREEFESKQQVVVKEDDKLDKSVVKLLSEAKQREYQLLTKQLLLANQNRRLRRLSQKILKNEKSPGQIEEAKPPKKQPVPGSLKKTLEQLQFEKDGRLQMKGKYKELRPLIQKVNQASDRRKLFEGNVSKAMRQLGAARKQHENATQVFTDLVQQLVQATENIDKRLLKLANTKPGTIIKCTNPPTAALNEIKPKPPPAVVENKPAATKTVVVCNEVASITNGDDESIANENEGTISYISPLDNRESTISKNPLKALCPYELFGVCKDQDCNFNHCP